jgi:Xaa-Pro dipeptidase
MDASATRSGSGPRTLTGPRVERLSEIARRTDTAAVLVSDPTTVRWLAADAVEGARALVGAGAAMVIDPFVDPSDEAAGLDRALHEFGIAGSEPLATDASADRLRSSRRSWVAAGNDVALARAVKDLGEVERIRAAAELAAAGQAVAREEAREGATEKEIWAASADAMAAVARGPVEAVVDLMAGARTALVGEPPGDARVRTGEPVLFDLAPRRDDYWADSCATFVVGAAPARLAKRHAAVRGALDAGLTAARPGVEAGGVDAAVRSELAAAGLECPHHTGHGVGLTAQEPPWLVPDDASVLEEGMVIAIEPGAYSGGFGVRLEQLALIEAGGVRLLTNHEVSLN